MLKFKVENQTLTRTDSFVPVADSRNYLTAGFEFSDEWAGDIVTVFTYGGDGYQLRPENGKCTSGYECFFSFKSGATATTLTVPSGITWTGADCNSGKEFAPLANTVYEVGIRCIGFASDGAPYLSARAGAC